jgi:DNA-directed RNA polymerase specialized sigma24 family protein
MYGLYVGAARGQFERLNDRADLWRLLIAITVNKALSRRERLDRKKRGGGAPAGQAADDGESDADDAGGGDLSALRSPEPTPEAAAIVDEHIKELLDQLGDPVLRDVALWRLDGLTNAEIARKMGCVTRTVERKLERIRLIWGEIGASPDE